MGRGLMLVASTHCPKLDESEGCHATGLLLYPAAKYSISEEVCIDGHWILWETLDLSLEWPSIEKALLLISA
jgi:hypothetical protein